MIKINEFRIGNFVLVDEKLQAVCAISLNNIELATYEVGYMNNDKLYYLPCESDRLQPVPINDEVLESCGFKFDTYFRLWQKMKKVLGTGMDMEMTGDYSVLDFSHRPILKEIEYLHHLQNLYYALKRKELEVNLSINQMILLQEESI